MMKSKFLLLFLIFSLILLLNLCLGEISLRPDQVFITLFDKDSNSISLIAKQILLDIRLPRAITASLVGLSLAVSGFLLQSLSRNNLADPYLTGVSSGAALSAAISFVLGIDLSLIPIISLSGGFTASLIVMALSRNINGISISAMLLSGLAISSFCSALITIMLCYQQGSTKAQNIYYWLAGSISNKSWNDLKDVAFYILLGLSLSLLLSKPLRILSLGNEQASSLGLNVARSQFFILFAAILLCSASVSLAGILGFVGLLAPYTARRFFGNDERILMIATGISGSILVLTSDLIARLLSAGTEAPLGSLLCLIGGPFFLFLLLQNKNKTHHL